MVKGDVTADEVEAHGNAVGKITSQRCEFKDKSRINGDIKPRVFPMEERGPAHRPHPDRRAIKNGSTAIHAVEPVDEFR